MKLLRRIDNLLNGGIVEVGGEDKLEEVLDSYIIINDVILYITISIIHVHVIFNVNFIYSATI